MGFLEIWNLFLFRPINLYVSLDIIVMANEFVAQCVKIYIFSQVLTIKVKRLHYLNLA